MVKNLDAAVSNSAMLGSQRPDDAARHAQLMPVTRPECWRVQPTGPTQRLRIICDWETPAAPNQRLEVRARM